MSAAEPYPSTRANNTTRHECAATVQAAEFLGRQEQTIRIPADRAPSGPRRAPARRDLRPLGAVVFLPPGVPGAGLWTDACGEYIERRGYRLAAVCGAWGDAVRMVLAGEAEVVVVGRRDHLPADRKPRVEVVTEAASTAENRRRPRRQR